MLCKAAVLCTPGLNPQAYWWPDQSLVVNTGVKSQAGKSRSTASTHHQLFFICFKNNQWLKLWTTSDWSYECAPNSGVPRNFVRGGFNKFSWGQRTENGDLGAVAPYPLVKGSGGSCNLVQEISLHIVSFLIFGTLRLFMMTTNLFVIANVKQLQT